MGTWDGNRGVQARHGRGQRPACRGCSWCQRWSSFAESATSSGASCTACMGRRAASRRRPGARRQPPALHAQGSALLPSRAPGLPQAAKAASRTARSWTGWSQCRLLRPPRTHSARRQFPRRLLMLSRPPGLRQHSLQTCRRPLLVGVHRSMNAVGKAPHGAAERAAADIDVVAGSIITPSSRSSSRRRLHPVKALFVGQRGSAVAAAGARRAPRLRPLAAVTYHKGPASALGDLKGIVWARGGRLVKPNVLTLPARAVRDSPASLVLAVRLRSSCTGAPPRREGRGPAQGAAQTEPRHPRPGVRGPPSPLETSTWTTRPP